MSKEELRDFLEKCYDEEGSNNSDVPCTVRFRCKNDHAPFIQFCTPQPGSSTPTGCQNGGICKNTGTTPKNEYFNIGEEAFTSQKSICDCTGIDFHGPYCEIPDSSYVQSDCGPYGSADQTNTVSGCQCVLNGTPTLYHGWYCNVENKVMCKVGQFYVHEENGIVGDKSNCKRCRDATTSGTDCGTCEQKNPNGKLKYKK